jgi:hypothetical protein
MRLSERLVGTAMERWRGNLGARVEGRARGDRIRSSAISLYLGTGEV